MNAECEVEHRASFRKFYHISFLRIDENITIKKFYIELCFKSFLIKLIRIDRNDLLKSFDPLCLTFTDGSRSAVLSISKMCRYSVLSDLIHGFGTNLNLNRKIKHTKNRRMQTLILIRLWHRDVIFNFFDERYVMCVNHSKNIITVTC